MIGHDQLVPEVVVLQRDEGRHGGLQPQQVTHVAAGRVRHHAGSDVHHLHEADGKVGEEKGEKSEEGHQHHAVVLAGRLGAHLPGQPDAAHDEGVADEREQERQQAEQRGRHAVGHQQAMGRRVARPARASDKGNGEKMGLVKRSHKDFILTKLSPLLGVIRK